MSMTTAMPAAASAPKPLFTIEPRSGWVPLNLREIWQFRDLLFSLAGRDIRLRYRQTALGVSWVVLQPLIAGGLFSLVFGLLGGMPSGRLPYFVLAFTGVLAYNVFSNTLSKAGVCLVGNAQLVSKVYFPRMVLPLSTSLSTLLDFAVGLAVLGVLMAVYHARLQLHPAGLLVAPAMIAIILLMALGAGLWASALTVSYRDVQYVLPVLLQFVMYATPAGYKLSVVAQRAAQHHHPSLFTLYMLNPLSSVIEAFRWACLGEGELHWGWIAYSAAFALVLMLLGSVAFRRMERRFADVI
jgi:lipopolysaccharide transport system permease protein